MSKEQRAAVANSRRVANPGCYPTGFIALVRPLVEAGLVPQNWPVTVNAVSGYSGGGRSMIAEFEDKAAPNYTTAPYRIYALNLAHKHVPEMQMHAGLAHPSRLRARRRPLRAGHDRRGAAAARRAAFCAESQGLARGAGALLCGRALRRSCVA